MSTKQERLGLFHQVGDYLVAGLLLLSLSRATVVGWPLALGVVALANAAMTRGPLAAYRRIPLTVHRIIEVGVIAACCIGAVVVGDHAADAAVLVVSAVVQAVIVWLSRVAHRAEPGRGKQ